MIRTVGIQSENTGEANRDGSAEKMEEMAVMFWTIWSEWNVELNKQFQKKKKPYSNDEKMLFIYNTVYGKPKANKV